MVQKIIVVLLAAVLLSSCTQGGEVSSTSNAGSTAGSGLGKSAEEIVDLGYGCAVMVEGKIYACVKNSLIRFNEDLSGMEILYTDPESILDVLGVYDQNSLVLCLDDNGDPPAYKSIRYNIQLNSIDEVAADMNDPVYYQHTVYFYTGDTLYKQQNGVKTVLVENVDCYRMNSKRIIYNLKSDWWVVYSCDLNGENVRKELEGVRSFALWGEYILFNTTWYPDLDVSIYSLQERKTVALGMHFNVDEAVIQDGKLFADGKVVRLKDLQVLQENLKWSDYPYKTVIGNWIYCREAERDGGIISMDLFRVNEKGEYQEIMKE